MKSKVRYDRLSQLSKALFGAPEDISRAEAIEDLETASIDREELSHRMYDKLCLLSRGYGLKGEEVPRQLKRALDDLRKRFGPPRTKEEFDQRADSTISKVLDAVKARPKLVLPKLAFSSEFRNKMSEQPAEDQQIIKNLERELESDLDEEQENQD
jgi:hypothetical protein